jgi:adenine C2-methylase RlmN of 23S rRNA A2503 and tRNA A37
MLPTSSALDYCVATTARKVFLEYILLDGVNASPQHAAELVRYVRSLARPALFHVNLIVYNHTDADYRQVARAQAKGFRDQLAEAGISATIRRNLGRDIDGACGQLALKQAEAPAAPAAAD